MNLRNILKNAPFLLLLYLTPSFLEIAEVGEPELQLLAANLKPEECVKLVSLDSHIPLSEAEIQKLAREQSCFRRLVKWICQLRTVTRNTYPILNDFLERIGRSDLVACLAELSMKSSKPPKVIRDVQAADDSEDYEGITTTAPTSQTKAKDSQPDTKTDNQFPSEAIEKISGHTTFKISLRTAGIVLASTILLTCCCTLLIRNRLLNLFNKIRGKKKKGKFIPIEDDVDISRSYIVRKPRIKRKRAPSYEMVHTATQNNTVPVAKEPEEPQPSCYKCYKKKRKKSTKRPHR
ncbi:unnamed protein product [Xylocopa violacea]|uniref:Death domain-containing protein n=1 Tax=Xylocopa violacea TaxID=135666 RepID=A0ABP1N915_XYLVO